MYDPASLRPVILCFAGDAWDGNPHSRHHLMRRFARDWDVLFIESVPMRSFARGDPHDLRRAWRKLRVGTTSRTVAPGLHVLRPLPIPPAGPAGRLAQLEALRAQIAWTRMSLGLRGPAVSWFSLPNVAPLRGRLGERASLFYYQDRYDAFSHVDGHRLRTNIEQLAEHCDVSVCTSEQLAEDLRAAGASPVIVPHGVDFASFATPAPRPEDLAGLEPPLIGYVGLIDDHVSTHAVIAVANRLERGTVVLVGGVNTNPAVLRHPRITLLGHRPFTSMPSYMQAFDCCLIPFALNRLTTAVNPIKLREYLAAGRPVVSTGMPAVRAYADVIEIADAPLEFADAVMRTLRPGYDDDGPRTRRRERVAGESWDLVASELGSILAGLLGAAGRLS